MAFKQDVKVSFDPIKRAISIHFGKDDLTPMSKPSNGDQTYYSEFANWDGRPVLMYVIPQSFHYTQCPYARMYCKKPIDNIKSPPKTLLKFLALKNGHEMTSDFYYVSASILILVFPSFALDFVIVSCSCHLSSQQFDALQFFSLSSISPRIHHNVSYGIYSIHETTWCIVSVSFFANIRLCDVHLIASVLFLTKN